MNRPAAADWTAAWEFAHAAPPELHSVRLVVDGIKNPGADVCVSLVDRGQYAVWQNWWTAWYPRDLPEMNCAFDAGQPLRRMGRDHAGRVELHVDINGDIGRPAEYTSAKLELVTLPEVK